MSGLRLRDAGPGDQEAVRALTLAAYAEYADALGPMWPPYRDNILQTLARVAPAQQIVAARDGALVGAVLLYPHGAPLPTQADAGALARWPEVRLLAVPPVHRGQGIAEALMRECVRRARAAGATSLTLHTTDMMRTAMRLYERLGFDREPALDFSPAPGITVKGFRLALEAVA
ncbi:MAG TPA: GNAT family N-acetyltransferase [Methylomirabilota bacterium]|nr:GNAT family N-acetyltransferase [Methylomirabilota bacterium]